MTISYSELRAAVAGDGVGCRAITELEPLGGQGDKVFPPTYGVDNRAETRYATETRRVNGEAATSVVLDSVASQANRFELALLGAIREGELRLPLVSTDFRGLAGIEDLDRISSLEAPHRIYDAILRDSLLGDELFRLSDIGQAITEASSKSAAALYRYAPATLLFGGWDSTGPRGGRGSKFERAITSEVVALGIELGRKTASRIDPLGIEKNAATLYEARDGDWTLDESEARIEKGKPVPYTRSGEGAPGRPSQVNHGNIAPSIDPQAGGVTADRIVATTVLSFIQLRRLRFPLDASGTPIDAERRRDVEGAARSVLAALGIAAVVLAFDEGFDLRSRCVLVAKDDLTFELVRRGSQPSAAFAVERSGALALVDEAVSVAEKAGLSWETGEILLRPAERLVELVRRSRAVPVAVADGDEAS